MKRPANAALATKRPESEKGMSISRPAKAKQRNHEPTISVSPYLKPENPAGKNGRPLIVLKCTSEQFKDVLWLIAAIVIIAIIHRYVPNSGAPPHSIVDVVRSATVFP